MKRCWVISVFLIGGAACWAQSDATPSLADIAKQKKDTKKATLVLTDDDVVNPSAPVTAKDTANADGSSPDNGGNADSKTSDKTAAKAKADTGSGPSSNSNSKDTPAVAEMKKKLDSLVDQRDSWKRSAKRYQDLLATENDDFRRQTYQDALNNDQNNVAVVQKSIDDVQAELDKAQKQHQ